MAEWIQKRGRIYIPPVTEHVLTLPDVNSLRVYLNQHHWWFGLTATHVARLADIGPDDPAPLRESLEQAANFLRSVLAEIEAKLLADSPQVAFSAAVDPLGLMDK